MCKIMSMELESPEFHHGQHSNKMRKDKKLIQWKLSRIYSWYFLLDLLQMEGTKHLVEWIDYDQLQFKIKNGLLISSLWSQVNGRKQEITYESFKRTLRHYYGKGIIEKIPKKPHCYQFVKSPKTMTILEDLYRGKFNEIKVEKENQMVAQSF